MIVTIAVTVCVDCSLLLCSDVTPQVQEDECELHIADDANTNTDTDDSGEYDDDDFETVDTPTVTM